jgi:sulfur-oxidizing protein SoxA
MQPARPWLLLLVLLCLLSAVRVGVAQERLLPLAEVRSGLHFAGADVKALQHDVQANPAQLWLAQGRSLWQAPAGPAQASCSSCHGDPARMQGVATQFPRIHAATGLLFNLEDQIRHCASQRQGSGPPAFESDALLALTALVTQASNGMPVRSLGSSKGSDPAGSAALQQHLLAGAALFQRRQGQLNLGCTHCHDRNWGRRFFTDVLSQGHPNGYPLYRLEWQALGSLERRLRSCHVGIRAEPPPYGDLALRQLALYLNWRADGLAIELPAVRK